MKILPDSIVTRIKVALIIPFLVVFVIVLMLVLQYRSEATAKMYKQCEYEASLLAQTFDVEIENVKNCTNMIILHLNELLSEEYLDSSLCPLPDVKTQRQINKSMMDAFTTFENLNQILIVWNNGSIFYENWTTNYFLSSGGEELLKELEGMDITRYGTWMPEMYIGDLLTGDGPIFAKSFIHINTMQQTGYVLLKASPIFELMDENGSTKKLQLYNNEGVLIKSSDNFNEADTGWDKEKIFKNELNLSNKWTLISQTDLSDEQHNLDIFILELLLLSMVLLVAIFMLTSRIITKIILPVRELSDHIERTRDGLPQPVAIQGGKDEVGILVNRFNSMAQRNLKLVDMLLQEKKRQEQLKFALLQVQVKPHFLYNTLDTIYCLSEMGKNNEASHMTKLLSEYYRNVLSHGPDWVLLSQEIKQTESYLAIQSIRYHDVLDYEVIWQEGVEDTRIPKLTLQPLVENAIYHGIKPAGRKGRLIISVRQNDETIEIRIKDNGIGMSPDILESVINNAQIDETSFGLRSVYERLRLYYQDRFSMTLEPLDDNTESGTCLLLCIPAAEEET